MKRPHLAFHLVWIGLIVLVLVSVTASMSRPTAASRRDVIVSSGSAAVITDMPDALPGGPGTNDLTPVACRKEPECSTDTDCIAFCGPSGGHCVHSSCPIRICKCR